VRRAAAARGCILFDETISTPCRDSRSGPFLKRPCFCCLKAIRIGTQRFCFVGPGAGKDGQSGRARIRVGKHPAGLGVDAAADPADAEPGRARLGLYPHCRSEKGRLELDRRGLKGRHGFQPRPQGIIRLASGSRSSQICAGAGLLYLRAANRIEFFTPLAHKRSQSSEFQIASSGCRLSVLAFKNHLISERFIAGGCEP
jgi:hypothetical protein